MKSFFGKIRRRVWIWLAVAAAVVLVFALALSARARSARQSVFQTSPLTRGDLVASVGATGTVRAAQSATLSWQTTGTVEEVNARVGDSVAKDDVLAALAMDSVPQAVIQAQASLVEAKRALEDAKSLTASAQAAITLKDAEEAYKKAYDYRLSLNSEQWIKDVRIKYVRGVQVPEIRWYKGLVDDATLKEADNSLALRKAELDDARRKYERLKDGPDPDDIAVAQANVEAAQATVNTARIISPIDGTVTQSNTLGGDRANVGSLAFRVDDLSTLLVDVEVSEIDINSIQVGQAVTLTLDAVSNITYQGTVDQVSQAGSTDAGSVVFTVTVHISDPDSSVKPGMTAAVNIVVNNVTGQLLVPNRAVRLVDNQRVVYVLKDGRAEPVEVTLGASSDTMSVLTQGDLKEGDPVILNPPSFNGGPFGGGPG